MALRRRGGDARHLGPLARRQREHLAGMPVGHQPDDAGLARLAAIMAGDHVDIEIDLGTGAAEATVYGCDLSADYVRINADYTT